MLNNSNRWALARCISCAAARSVCASASACNAASVTPDFKRARPLSHSRLRHARGVNNQGDLDGIKGLYHINAVDCVTQWEVVATVRTISEAHLLPVIEQRLEQFPFEILGFHADNGSEYVNHRVAKMLDKLKVEFTRSRPRHSNDNGLAEYLNPFLNFHRPCLFATDKTDPKKPGRIKRVYRPQDAMTPLDKLASLPDVHTCLREGITLEHLRELAMALSDVQAAEKLNEARAALFKRVPARTG